jgi:hypothetical protein
VTIDERTRHQLYLRLEAVLGAEEATTLMEHLPPVGWADVATKHDLHALETRMDLRFEQINLRFDSFGHQLRAEFQHDLRVTMLAVVTANAALVAVAASLANLF